MTANLRCLTVKQPWAWAIVVGLKDVENREWAPRYRGRLGIHAGRRVDPEGFAFMRRLGITPPPHLPTGALIGIVDLVDVVEGSPSPWAFDGQKHWLLRSARVLDRPISMRGQMSLFGAPAMVADAVCNSTGDLHQAAADHDAGSQRTALLPIAERDVPLPFEPWHR